MLEPSNNNELPTIPGKRYFTIGEVSELCAVKPHVLRYWEQEFPSLSPVKRRGNRRYYQRQDVVLIRQIRSLLYEHGLYHWWCQTETRRRVQQARANPVQTAYSSRLSLNWKTC